MIDNEPPHRQERSKNNLPIQRRDVLKATGAATVGISVISGVASATDKGVSWVAFCGCDSTPCIRFIKQQDDDESITELAYSDENCDHVYYKLGQEVREDNSGTGDPDVGSPFIINTDEPDPVVGENDPDINKDPCGELSGTTGTKLEADEILDEDGNLKDEFSC